VSTLSFEAFFNDEMRVDAVVRNLEIIGEAANHIPDEVREDYSFVEWKKIIAFRNILAHEYFGIDSAILWDIIKNKLPQTEKDILQVMDEERLKEE
jgi:uncharacterized protein with HEPN domain